MADPKEGALAAPRHMEETVPHPGGSVDRCRGEAMKCPVCGRIGCNFIWWTAGYCAVLISCALALAGVLWWVGN